jgi:hypothetical protein
MKTSRLLWKCRCMPEEAALEVRARAPGEDIAAWMEGVVLPSVTRAHTAWSPLCGATAVEYLKLPIPEDGRGIGESAATFH